MGKYINLNSKEWRDIVFDGKNKKYGAYALRKTSSNRHIIAFLITIAFVVLVALIPLFLKSVKPKEDKFTGSDDAFEMTDVTKVEEELQEEDIIRQETAPPPPPVKATIQFTPPVVVEDSKVREDKEMKSTEELKEKKDLEINVVDNQEGSKEKDAIDPEELLEKKQVVQEPPKQEKPYTKVEQMPQYPGGPAELLKYIGNNLRYPTIAAENGIEGRVVIQFVVSKTGDIKNVRVLKSLDPSCDKEAIRVVKSMPKWIPGMQNGHNVDVYYTLPVRFKLKK